MSCHKCLGWLLLQNLGRNQYRVAFVGPEMALSSQFHAKVLNSIQFTENIISLVIDEGHCISEWGIDEFRPDFAKIVNLAARLPSGLPIMVASATMPRDIIQDIQHKLGLPEDCARIQVSNEKLNVKLSVRILQHPPDTFADLLLLFPEDPASAEDFLQTLFYTNGRQDAEKIQDFLRDNAPDTFDPEVFEFYHRDIDEKRKTYIQDGINSGKLRGVPATDALGLVSIKLVPRCKSDHNREWTSTKLCVSYCGCRLGLFFPWFRRLDGAEGTTLKMAKQSFTSRRQCIPDTVLNLIVSREKTRTRTSLILKTMQKMMRRAFKWTGMLPLLPSMVVLMTKRPPLLHQKDVNGAGKHCLHWKPGIKGISWNL